MRDISAKVKTLRVATARAEVRAAPKTISAVREGRVPKGDPLAVARVAAVQAAKDTSRIIPYCHPLPVDFVGVEFDVRDDGIAVEATVKAIYKTGVEMEALTAATVAALTLYDMLKMLDDSMEILGVRLVEKRGGKSDFARTALRIAGRSGRGREEAGGQECPPSIAAGVLVISDSVATGKKGDASGHLIKERLEEAGVEVSEYAVVPDEAERIREAVLRCADMRKLDLVITTGGTGFSPRDRTPEAMEGIIERDAPGIAEAMRAYGQERTPHSMLSRGRAGIRGETLIVNLPGSRRGVAESLEFLLPYALHAFKILRGGGHGGSGYANEPSP